MIDGESLPHLIRLLPKVELHVHLEGSIRPETLLKLARRRSVNLPADDVDGLRQWFQFEDFADFVDIYLTCCRCLRDPEDFQLVAEEFLTEQARQNILYSEVHFTIGTHLANGVNGGEVAEALYETLCGVESTQGVRARLIPDIVRNAGVERADETLEWALESRHLGVIALGLSGFEEVLDDPFREHFEVAGQEGLHRVAHAGEHKGPETIRSALEVCGAERIGHGIGAVEDPELIETLRSLSVPIEVCPTSNVRLGAVENLESHPFDELNEAGLQVTINSDDPPFFETSLSDEYLRLAQVFGYSIEDLAQFSWRALDHAFVDSATRAGLVKEYESRLDELGIKQSRAPISVQS